MNGILLIDKPTDWTSHDVVAKLRGILRERRIGHAGTLDPMATGLLTIFVGRATRGAQFAEAEAKTYIARLQPGIVTDTQDITGRVLEQSNVSVSRGELEAILPQFQGEIEQVPPMYSAIQIDGQRLYKLARQGVEVERKARPVTIHDIRVLGEAEGSFDLEITCSKGTYIRTLCHDMGQALGSGGTMAALRRTRVGAFSLDEACTLDDLKAAEDPTQFLRPVDTLFAEYPSLTVNERQEQKIRNGQQILRPAGEPGRCRVYSEGGEFLALGEIFTESDWLTLKSIKSFYQPNM